MDPRSYRGYIEHFIIRLIKSLFLGVIGYILPHVRYVLGHP